MIKVWNIHGGIHPPENKEQSLTGPIQAVPLPALLTLPLSQHLGAPASPLVKMGDKVLKGQMIAEANGFISASVHAPTSGTIVTIDDLPVPHASGMEAPCIVIKSDGEDRWIEHSGVDNYSDSSPAELLSIIHNAGITGLGGAGFPSAVKLQPRQAIKTLIINATECEPYITADDQLIRQHAAEILVGVDILAHILGRPERVLIGIEDNKPKAQEALANALKDKWPEDVNVQIIAFPTKYPSGGEKQLIQILTGEEVPSGKLPADLGIICQNIGTTHAIYRAVCFGEPLISRVTTVTGKACNKPGNFQVLIGTPIEHILAQGGFDEFLCQRLVMGGPMMGFALPNIQVPVIKSTNCLLATTSEESPAPTPAQACIRCGHCAEACPASLLPQQLYWHAQAKNYARLEAHHLADCIECGACSYVCPSNIPLVQYYRAVKGEMRQIAEDKKQSDRARARFEHHQARVLREEEEKAAKREVRRLAAQAAKANTEAEAENNATDNKAGNAGAADIVKAAMARVAANKTSLEDQRQRCERAVETTAERLKKTQQVLAQLEPADTTEAQAKRDQQLASIEQARLRHQEAQNKLAALNHGQNQAGTSLDIATNKSAQNSVEGDVDLAAAAIARAQKNSAAHAALSPQAKLEMQRDSLLKRLEKAQARAGQAEAEGSEQLDAFNNAVVTLQAKLQNVEAELGAQDINPVEKA